MLGSEAGDSQRAERDAFRPCQFGWWRVPERGAQWRRRADQAACRDQDDAAHHRRMVSGQAARDPVTEGMTEDVHGAALESLKNSGNVRCKIMKGRIVKRPPAGPHASHVDGNDL